KRFLSSFSPSCLPALEKGGHGKPPETISTPLNAEASVNLMRSSCITFHCGRFRRRVSQACPSISMRPECSIPACSSPSACPPAPAQSSSVVSGDFMVSPVQPAADLGICLRQVVCFGSKREDKGLQSIRQ